MELHEALSQVVEIRRQIARSETFRGYRALPAAFSSLVAFAGAIVQHLVAPQPAAEPAAYLGLWVAAALLSVGVTAAEMTIRCRRAASPHAARMTLWAVEQFLPCLIAGALVTLVIAQFATEVLWMLPGLWGILFGLGIFASNRLLPRAIFWVAVYYMACGLWSLAWGQGPRAFSPWTMAVTFGGGQAITAAVLYLTLERNHEPPRSQTSN
jgi:hypothetical protein